MAAAIVPAWGMSCFRQPLPSMVAEYDHIFVAQVKSATLADDKRSIEATFEVETVLKGTPQEVSRIRSPFNDQNYKAEGPKIALIQPDVSPGMHLLVFAKGRGPAEFSGCSPTTRVLQQDDGRIEAVRQLLKGAAPASDAVMGVH
jgi:hypothetical protein